MYNSFRMNILNALTHLSNLADISISDRSNKRRNYQPVYLDYVWHLIPPPFS